MAAVGNHPLAIPVHDLRAHRTCDEPTGMGSFQFGRATSRTGGNANAFGCVVEYSGTVPGRPPADLCPTGAPEYVPALLDAKCLFLSKVVRSAVTML